MEDINKNFVIGIDIGGTYFRIGMVDQSRQLNHLIVESSSILNKDNAQLKNLIAYVENYIRTNSTGTLIAVCIGFPSAVCVDKKVVFQSPNIYGFDNVNVAEPLEMVLGVPVYVENDVNNLLVSEIIDRSLDGYSTVLGIYFGTGLGNAIYINGSILQGKHGVAGELGHIPVLDKNNTCGCGNKGCIEMFASGKRLEEIRTQYFPETNIRDVFKQHADNPVIHDYIENLSIPIAVEINIFDPDYIIVGGGVVNMKGFPKEELEKCVYNHTRKPHPAESLKLVFTDGGSEVGVRGAAYNAYKRLGIEI